MQLMTSSFTQHTAGDKLKIGIVPTVKWCLQKRHVATVTFTTIKEESAICEVSLYHIAKDILELRKESNPLGVRRLEPTTMTYQRGMTDSSVLSP